MRALTYHGTHDVRVESVADPVLREPDDILLRVTATAICGSDLHLYRGKIPELHSGDILGHEFMGVVEEAGPGVTRVKRGDRVVIPFVIACGECYFCAQEEFAACKTTNSGRGANVMQRDKLTPPAALFGYSHLYGGVPGGQAELVRVPKANVGPLVVPGSLSDERVLFLSDILPTGFQAVERAGVKRGSSMAIFGAGPVGQMAAASARLLGAERIFIVDDAAYRLAFAAQHYGAEPIDFSQVDPAEAILDATSGRGVDVAVDAVGFEAKGSAAEKVLTALKIETSSGASLRQCIAATRRCGSVAVPGVYAGMVHAFMLGDAFDKALSFTMGQTHVQRYLPRLLEYIEAGALQPDVLISHRMKLADAAEGYRMFNAQEDECRKIVMTP